MFLTRDKPQQGRFFTGGYGTAGTTTTTSLASQGGLLINIDSATGDIPQTASGWIESDRFGFYNVEFAGSTSGEFDTAVTRTGNKTLKLSTLDATGRARAYMMPVIYGTPTTFTDRIIPCKVNTKYIFSCWVKTTNVVTVSITVDRYASGVYSTSFATPSLTGTNDWTRLVYGPFTTSGVQNGLGISFFNNTAGNISDVWFDINSMTLEEVIEPVANSLVTPSPSLVSFTAVGSTDNIDQSQLTVNDARGVGGDGSTAVITNKLAQQFTPTKSKFAGIIIRKIADIGTFTGTITAKLMNDNTGAIGATTLASLTLSNATYQAIANDTDYTINLPSNLTADGITKYWVTLEASTSDASNYARIRVQSGNSYTGGIFQAFYSAAWNTVAFDLYFKTLYYKPTTNFKASQNNLSVSVSADEDGFLNTGVYNLLTGAYSFSQTNDTSVQIGTSSYSFIPNLFSYSTTTPNGTSDILLKSTTTMSLKGSQVGIVVGTYKINMTLLSSIVLTGCVRFAMAEWSYDNATWNTINDNRGSLTEIAISQSIPASGSYVYLRFTSGNAANASYIGSATNQLVFTGVVTTSGLSVLKNYPTNKDIIKQYATTLSGATTSATYRATKWGFPAIEYSATEYQFLDVDTTATGSTVAFSELGTTYTTVADGASLAISSTSNPNIFVKANITANRIYSSSNDYSASSDKDGSLRQNITYQVVQ